MPCSGAVGSFLARRPRRLCRGLAQPPLKGFDIPPGWQSGHFELRQFNPQVQYEPEKVAAMAKRVQVRRLKPHRNNAVCWKRRRKMNNRIAQTNTSFVLFSRNVSTYSIILLFIMCVFSPCFARDSSKIYGLPTRIDGDNTLTGPMHIIEHEYIKWTYPFQWYGRSQNNKRVSINRGDCMIFLGWLNSSTLTMNIPGTGVVHVKKPPNTETFFKLSPVSFDASASILHIDLLRNRIGPPTSSKKSSGKNYYTWRRVLNGSSQTVVTGVEARDRQGQRLDIRPESVTPGQSYARDRQWNIVNLDQTLGTQVQLGSVAVATVYFYDFTVVCDSDGLVTDIIDNRPPKYR